MRARQGMPRAMTRRRRAVGRRCRRSAAMLSASCRCARTSWTRSTSATSRAAAQALTARVPASRSPTPHAAEQPVEEGFAGHPEDDRRAERTERGQVGQQVQVVRKRLAESDARVDENLGAAVVAGRHPLGQVVADLGDHVVVVRGALHRPRLAPHVHRDDRSAVPDGDLQHRVAGAGDVVDHHGAGCERPVGRLRLRRIDAERHAEVERRNPLDDRQQARNFVLQVHGRGARPGALRADVDQVRALRRHPACMVERPVRTVEAAAVREAVRRHVEHPHDERAARERQGVRAADQLHGRSLRATEPGCRRLNPSLSLYGDRVDAPPWRRRLQG